MTHQWWARRNWTNEGCRIKGIKGYDWPNLLKQLLNISRVDLLKRFHLNICKLQIVTSSYQLVNVGFHILTDSLLSKLWKRSTPWKVNTATSSLLTNFKRLCTSRLFASLRGMSSANLTFQDIRIVFETLNRMKLNDRTCSIMPNNRTQQ